ncbi:MAG TPA: HupE/UreJ family protein [Povalibacter sp.]|mgnify:CR=1 FL=1|uniref:HupE/UreJ family protein n=1 Tax=Povalibacter sp. TaxID=1962978 RepID=UPI002C7D89E1|nr:HupE/UreJ family protein [Povalibacter sp.]HMN43745.1 HupE/UreJ family protein [Povalibacter sp.]
MRTVLRLALLLLAACVGQAHADVFRPAYLELTELGAGDYAAVWKVPTLGDARLALTVHLPSDTSNASEPRRELIRGALLERWQVRTLHGLAGRDIRIDGLQGTQAEVLVRVIRLDGSTQVERLTPSRTSFTVNSAPGALNVAGTYLVLGIQHILEGIDHLLFVLALLLIVRGVRRILVTITAFTVAHSITLVAATLGFIHVPGPPVEVSIALSIVFLAREVVMTARGRPGVTERWPWIVAFVFGLLHGLGFAGALAEVGLPPRAIPVALLFFNVGVEIGQLIFVGVALSVMALARRYMAGSVVNVRLAASYAIGTIATLWTVERVAAFWS